MRQDRIKMKFGYARVSTKDQHLDTQIDILLQAGIERRNIFTDTISGKRSERPGLDTMLAKLRADSDDEVVVVKLDRLGRSMPHIIGLIDGFRNDGIGFRSINDGVDTSTANGRLLLNMLTSIAEYERELVRERTMAGLATARAEGKLGGRKKVMDEKLAKRVLALTDSGHSPAEIATVLGKSRPTGYRYAKEAEEMREHL